MNITLLVPNSELFGQLVRSREPHSPVVARSVNAMQLLDGRWLRFYLLADGSVQQRKFDTAEEVWDEISP